MDPMNLTNMEANPISTAHEEEAICMKRHDIRWKPVELSLRDICIEVWMILCPLLLVV